MNGVFWIIYLALIVAIIAGWWMIFTKAGEDGWKSIIPIWNILDASSRSSAASGGGSSSC